MQYQTNLATSDLQTDGNTLLSQVITQLQALSGGASESQELAAINSLIAMVASSANQVTAQTTLTAILAALSPLATSANQATANSALAAIQSIVATAAKQDTANTALSAIQSTVATSAKQDTANTSLASIDNKLTASTSATLTQISQSTSSVVALAANPNRKGFYLYNDSGQKVYVAFAATASAAAFSILIAPNSGQESPSATSYKGIVSVIWSGAGSNKLQVTELL